MATHSLRILTLGVALGDVSHEVREVGGNNMGPRVAWYLKNCVPPIIIPAPWCAAAVQGCSDIAARAWGIPNPLDEVRQEALVLSYYEWARDNRLIVPAEEALPGDLAFYDFHPDSGNPWDHIGLLLDPVDFAGAYRAIEGNTGSQSQRDGDGMFLKGRSTRSTYKTAFARWAA